MGRTLNDVKRTDINGSCELNILCCAQRGLPGAAGRTAGIRAGHRRAGAAQPGSGPPGEGGAGGTPQGGGPRSATWTAAWSGNAGEPAASVAPERIRACARNQARAAACQGGVYEHLLN